MHKDLTACDSLKKRYSEQLENTLKFADANLLLINERDSINELNKRVNLKLNLVQDKLNKTNQKKGISIFEGFLIGIGALGLGAIIF